MHDMQGWRHPRRQAAQRCREWHMACWQETHVRKVATLASTEQSCRMR